MRLPYNGCISSPAPPANLKPMGHPPRIPMCLRWEQSVIYFVTICVANRTPVLANENTFVTFKNAAAKLRDWNVLAAILMPDHLHVIVSPNRGSSCEDRQFRVGNEAIDAPRTERIVEMATRLF